MSRTRIQFDLDGKRLDKLDEFIASEKSTAITRAEVLRNALDAYFMLREYDEQGYEVVAKGPGDSVKLVFL